MRHQLKEEIKDNSEANNTQETSKNILEFDVINIKKEKDETNFESNTATAFERVEEHESKKQSSKIKSPISCEICHRSYRRKNTLKSHMNTHTRAKVFKCSECNKEFLWNQGLKRHWLQVHKKEKLKAAIEKPHQCELCDKKFGERRHLIIHTRVHTGEKPFECSKCDKKYPSKASMKIHMQKHMEKIKKAAIKKPHQCEHCDKKFGETRHLINHTRVHTGERPFECSKCGKKYASNASMKIHMQKHMEKIKRAAIEKPHKCELCCKKYVHRSNLIIHTRVHTGEKPFECSKCGKKFSSKGVMQIHMQTHMKEIKKPIPCKICHKSYAGKDVLRLHMNIHTREKVFKCSECNKEFLWKLGLKRHWLLKHKKEKSKETQSYFKKETNTYDCNLCDKKYKHKFTLTSHMKLHTGNNLHQCPKCYKKFERMSGLKSHLKSHASRRLEPIPCKICLKSYPGKDVLKLHMNRHTRREKLFKCSECDKEFLWNHGRKRHWLRVHKKEKLKEILRSNSGEIAMLSTDDLMGEIKSKLKAIKAEKIDVIEIAMNDRIDTEKTVKSAPDEKGSSYLPYNSCFGETICKEEVILPDENLN